VCLLPFRHNLPLVAICHLPILPLECCHHLEKNNALGLSGFGNDN
jgi:hypothetical protein